MNRSFLKRLVKWVARTAGVILLAGGGASVVAVIGYGFLPIPATPLMGLRAVEASFAGRSVHFNKHWVPLESIPSDVQRAAIGSEDFLFNEHHGFDFEAIRKAREFNERAARNGQTRLRGASTISQQTAKNVFLWPGRSWVRKAFEAWFTVLIEGCWSKRRILEVYLNVVEFGDGVYGIDAAAHQFFHKPARRLTSNEAALLIAVLPNPRRLRVDAPTSYVRYRQSSILRRLPYVDLPE